MCRVDDQTLQRRAELARRLKAARWLAGGTRPNVKGKAGYEVTALTPEDLAKRPGMAENQITASKIGSIERMERHTPPMEIATIARALGLPETWFASDRRELASSPAFETLVQLLGDLGLVPDTSQAESPARESGPDHPGRSAEGGGA